MSTHVSPSRSRRPTRLAATLCASAVACAVPATVSVATAHATGSYRVVGTGGTLRVHTAPSLGSPVVGNLPDGTPITVACQTRGDLVVGSTMWDRIDSPDPGYVADWYTTTPVVNNFSPGLADCSAIPTPTPTPIPTPAPSAIHDLAAYASSFVGQVRVPAAVPRSWHVGPNWSGFCEAFVGWVTAGPHGRPYGSALQDYYGHRGHIHTGVPPRNTVVYWNPPGSGGAGHIGISIGGGQVVSTVGFVGQHLAIAKNNYRTFGNYLGWANP
jgi:hypothetical protein